MNEGARKAVTYLVYLTGTIGDTVVAIPALRALRAFAGPEARICILHQRLARMALSPRLVLEGSSLADEFIEYEYPDMHGWAKLRSVLSVWLRLYRRKWAAVVYLAFARRDWRSVARDKLFFRLCGIRSRIGFVTFSAGEVSPTDPGGRPARTRHEAEFRLERLRRSGVPIDEGDVWRWPLLEVPAESDAQAAGFLQGRRKWPARPLIAVCPGAKQPANRWPLENFRRVVTELASRCTHEIVVVGGAGDKDSASVLLAGLEGCMDATGQLDVLGSAALLKRCQLVVGLDTGTTHLAAALGVPCVAIYGERENPGLWEPLGAQHRILRATVPCAGCRLTETPCPVAGHPCMTLIDPEMVLSAISEVMKSLPVGGDFATPMRAD